MERLTEEYGNYAIIDIQEINESIKSLISINNLITELLKRLAAYEDSGLTPEEVMELAKIVRCGECKYFQKDDCTMNDFFDFFETRKNAFCSYGERKES